MTGITKPMQVVMFNSASNGVDRGTDLVIPMLFTVGGSVDPNPDGTNSPTPTLQPSPESEPNVTATLNVYLSDLLSIISQLKKQFGKSDKQEQLDLRASLRTLANEFLDFVSTNDSEVHTTSANFDLLKASRNAKSKVVRLSGKKKNGFQRKKLQAKKAILGIQKKLSI
ncbi:MAG: hypothetical protein KDD70_17655 [Bdellovibrionales bacterium]|nr:hypothetical protein [Bdellovibrionales bacterium]